MTNLGFMIASLLLFCVSLYFYKKPNKFIFSITFYFILVIISFILFITYAVSDYLSGNGIDDATIYHLKYGLGGAGFLEYKSLIIITITTLILGSILFFWFFIKKKQKGNNIIAYIFILISFFLNPASNDLYNAFNIDYSDSDDFFIYYNNPSIKQISEKTKNFVFIYGEGLEYTYFNQKVFPGLIKELRKLEPKTLTFTNIVGIPGNGFTMGGIVNSLLGIPLVTTSFGNSMSGMDSFLPSAIGLGDLLKDQGYHLAYYGGANLRFAGKGKFFTTHGFDEVLGKNEILPKLKDKTYLNGWGLYDDTLLDIVYNRFLELSESKKKFGLFTLTLDTHHPNGHVSRSFKKKYKDGSNPILNAVACSDFLIAQLINRIMASKYADNTIIVLVSDHLSLKNSAFRLLRSKVKTSKGKMKRIKRRCLFKIIDPSRNQHEKANILGSNFDIASTVLPFIGYSGNIGLGRDLFLNKIPETSMEDFIRKNSKKIKIANKKKRQLLKKSRLKRWKNILIKFWNFPKLKKSIIIDIKEHTIQLDSRKFKIPILIELNKKFETKLKFRFSGNRKQKTFVKQLSDVKKDNFFFLIDKGKNLNFINDQLIENSFYLITGKGNSQFSIKKLDTDITFSIKKIRELLKTN